MPTKPIASNDDPIVSEIVVKNAENAQSSARNLLPIASSDDVTTFPQSVATVNQTSVTITSSLNNDSGDVTTVYTSGSQIIVNPINQTVNQYNSTVTSGTSYSNANVAAYLPTYTGNITAGNIAVTGNITANNIGNVASKNYDGNASNVLHGDGSWSADITTYGNSNVASYLPTYTGNISANVVNANYLYGDGSNITNLPVGNIASINLDGNASNVLRGDGTFGADANSSYGDSNVTSLLGAFGSNNISTTGNVSVGDLNVSGNVTSNLLPNANVTFDLGSNSQRWNDLWLANSTIYLGDATLSANGNSLVVDNLSVTNSNVNSIGNIAAINLDGNVSNTLLGNGTWGPAIGPQGESGFSGYSGQDGLSGFSGYSGQDGLSGFSGYSGAAGPQGDRYSTSSATSLTIATGTQVLTVNTGLAYTIDQDVVIANAVGISMNGPITTYNSGNGYLEVNVLTVFGSGTYTSWTVNLDGAAGIPGPQGESGFSGYSGQDGLSGFSGYSGQDGLSGYSGISGFSGAGASLPLANGNSQFDIATIDGNVTITANSTSTWTFSTDGNLTLANGNSVIFSIANSSLDPTLPNVSTMTLTPDANYNSQVLVLDPTAPGHIHLRAHAFSNIDDPAANIFLGGENTAFEITQGANNEARIHSNSFTWTFNNDGNVTLPGGAQIVTTFVPNSVYLFSNINSEVGLASADGNTYAWVNDSGFNVTTNYSGIPNEWLFAGDGRLIAPQKETQWGNTSSGNILGYVLAINSGGDEVVISTAQTNANFDSSGPIYIMPAAGRDTTTGSGGEIYLYGGRGGDAGGDGGNIIIQGGFGANAGNAGFITITGGESANGQGGNVTIAGGLGNTDGIITLQTANTNANSTHTWTFGTDGTLTLPADYTLGLDDGLPILLLAAPNTSEGIRLRASPDPTNEEVFLYLGADGLGNNIVSIGTGGGGGGYWTFGQDGNFTTQGGLVITGYTNIFGADTSLIRTSPFDEPPLLILSSGANGAVSSVWVEDVANVGTSNIAAVYVNPTVGSGIVRIAVGQNGNAGPNLWDFGTTGNLTLPGNTVAINFANGSSAFGNIVATNLDGSNSNVLYGNGVFAPASGGSYGDSNVATLLGSFGSNSISTTGNVTANNFSGNTNGFTIGYLNIPQVSFGANATLGLTDAGKHYYSTTAGNLTLTIPDNGNVAFATGTAVNVVVQAAGNVLVNAAAGVTLYIAGNSTAANRVISAYGMATLMKVGTDTWFISGTGVS